MHAVSIDFSSTVAADEEKPITWPDIESNSQDSFPSAYQSEIYEGRINGIEG